MNEYINLLDKSLIDSLCSKNTPLGLASGKMGFCLYFFYRNRINANEQYKLIAEKLLDEIFAEINTVKSIDINNGLSGIGLGLIYLINQKYVKGNINEILKDIDDCIFLNLSYPKRYDSINTQTTIHLLLFLYIRLKDQKLGSESEYLFKELIIQTINVIYQKINLEFFEETLYYNVNCPLPQFLYILSEIYNMNFYNYRITKILEELSPKILSTAPLLHVNKLCLLWGMNCLRNAKIKGWDFHIRRLQKEIDINVILSNELKNKNIFFDDGLTSLYFILLKAEPLFPDKDFTIYKQIIVNKIQSSTVWNLLLTSSTYFDAKKGLFNGYCGASILINMVHKL